ncbi:MAG: hypothetical protein LBV01_01965 [Deltaproteobacteria bacterium]|jgi:hypothetical protein|nr:hypothetical protein [Deltaproteobacteria bacterium]
MLCTFPPSLEPHLLPDAAFAGAYDALTPEERAHIKTAIARFIAATASCGCPEAPVARSVKTLRQGFCLHEHLRPADWAIIAWDADYAGPTRILAALLPAILAGVPAVLACRVVAEGISSPFPPAVLAALELAGQELVAVCSPQEALALVRASCGMAGSGRIALLGGDESLDRLAEAAREKGAPCRRLGGTVRIGLDSSSLPPALLGAKALRFAHPDAAFVTLPSAEEGGLSAVFCGREAVSGYMETTPLALTPGQEACWIWPDLDAAFFQEKARGFCPGPDDDPS